jgi:hypothetical protein
MFHIHSNGSAMVEYKLAKRVLGESSHPSCPQPQAGQSIGDIIFATSYPYLQVPSKLQAFMARRAQPNHTFS